MIEPQSMAIEAAVADVIDNSISAEANVWLNFD